MKPMISAVHPIVSRVTKLVMLVLVISLVLGQSSSDAATQSARISQRMDHPAIEWLKFQVPPDKQADFIQKDAEIWNPVLSSSPAYAGKEVWTNPNHADDVIFVIYWTSRTQWKAIPEDLLERTTQRFNEAVGGDYPLTEAKEFQPVSEFSESTGA
ncbi:MAG: TIGR03792 family protein [Elainellaceae cyanobacterium]